MAKNKKNKGNKTNTVKIQQVDVKSIRNDDLKKAMEDLRAGFTREKEVKMFEELQKARFLSPVIFPEGVPGMQVRLVMINTPDGKAFFPVFTDHEEAMRLPMKETDRREYIVRSLKDFEVIFRDTRGQALGIVVNPFSNNIVLPRDLISKLNAAKASSIMTAATAPQKPKEPIPAALEPRFEEPRIYPTALVNAVYDKCGTIPEISRVWFKQMMLGPVANFALIVEADTYTKEIEDSLKEAAEPLAKEVPVYVLPLNEKLDKLAINGAVALYDRELSV